MLKLWIDKHNQFFWCVLYVIPLSLGISLLANGCTLYLDLGRRSTVWLWAGLGAMFISFFSTISFLKLGSLAQELAGSTDHEAMEALYKILKGEQTEKMPTELDRGDSYSKKMKNNFKFARPWIIKGILWMVLAVVFFVLVPQLFAPISSREQPIKKSAVTIEDAGRKVLIETK